MMFPTREEVQRRINACRANPAIRPPSNDYCRACLLAGMLHCSEVEYCGARISYDAVDPADLGAEG